MQLGEFRRSSQQSLAIGEAYNATIPVRIPDGIDGPFYVLVLTDSPASLDRSIASDIGFGNIGVGFEQPYTLGNGDQLQEAARLLGRGSVLEYQQEGNNTAKFPLTVVRATTARPAHQQYRGTSAGSLRPVVTVAYTVTNFAAILH